MCSKIIGEELAMIELEKRKLIAVGPKGKQPSLQLIIPPVWHRYHDIQKGDVVYLVIGEDSLTVFPNEEDAGHLLKKLLKKQGVI